MVKQAISYGVVIVLCVLAAELTFRSHYAWVTRNVGTVSDIALANTMATTSPKPASGADVSRGSIAPMIQTSPDPNIIYELKPDLDVIFNGVQVRTSSQGWREKYVQIPKPENTIRIVGIGDSIMFGWGVEENERAMDILEAELQWNYPRHSWEAIVLAVPGYNLSMEVAVLKRYGLAFDPDLIIYGFTGNDSCLPDFVRTNNGFFSAEIFAKRYYHYWRNSVPLTFDHRDRKNISMWKICDENDVAREYRHLVGKESYRNSLVELGEIGERFDIPVIMRTMGYFSDSDVPSNIVRIDLQSSLTNFKNLHGEVEFIRPMDGHPNALAHGLMAKALFQKLKEGGVVDRLISE